MPGIHIERLGASPETTRKLAEILIEVVAGGGSVSFMHPLSEEVARDFWDESLAAADEGKRVVFGAWDGGELAGTVTLLLDFPPNQPHRAEVSRMMTRPGYRGFGIATSLLSAAESIAAERGKIMIMLDTASEEGAAGFYEKAGYTFAGEIPDFAFKPHGGLTATKFYWKRLSGNPVTCEHEIRLDTTSR